MPSDFELTLRERAETAERDSQRRFRQNETLKAETARLRPAGATSASPSRGRARSRRVRDSIMQLPRHAVHRHRLTLSR